MKKYRLYQIDFEKYEIELFIDKYFYAFHFDLEQLDAVLDVLNILGFKRDVEGE